MMHRADVRGAFRESAGQGRSADRMMGGDALGISDVVNEGRVARFLGILSELSWLARGHSQSKASVKALLRMCRADRRFRG